ncbi:MAG: ubiquinone/menaquinone biosynthesis methyltransferase [Thermoplasmatales archaeon]|jgi:demethylmenaquinone methyltransferase/2-methoxy-6-polyprenyl-1,4-benzoquinol methylase|nr:ubiquinone/menaquinone biosynthesis methyltransferase [Thermoplasmatales archaeon]
MKGDEKAGNQFEGKEVYVKDVFNDIAPYYDKMNDIMSVGMIERWHKFMFKKAGDITGFSVLDVGTGTGELAFMSAKKAGPEGRVTGLDITPAMLEMAKLKVPDLDLPAEVTFVVGDALDMEFGDDLFDLVISGYMLRNVTDIQTAVDEMYRVLKPGCLAVVAELAKPRNRVVRWGHKVYMNRIVPFWGRKYDKGKVIDGKQPAYDWLTSSLEGFPYGQEMIDIFEKAGFTDAEFYVKSMGAVNIYVARKPQ